MNFFLLVPVLMMATPAAIMAANVVEARRWPRVPGVVLSTGLARMKSPGSPAQSFRPTIRYRYTVDGKDYVGDVLIHGMRVGGYKRWAQRIIDRYPTDSAVTVMHHPTQPEKACLETRFGFFGWVLVVLALLLLALAVAV